MPRKPPLQIQPTTLWDYPSQNYGSGHQGDSKYAGVTPSYIIWNLLQRYTAEGDVVVDPCCGSGTTLDVCRDVNRRGVGFDVNPQRPSITNADARKLPLDSAAADFVFIDPPYGTHIDYSDDPRCLGKLDAAGKGYYRAMGQVFAEIDRILKPDKHMALYVSDSFVAGEGFLPLGFDLFSQLRERFTPVDIISVTRHNKTLEMGNYRRAAEEGNYFLRGFNYLFVFYKPGQHANAARATQAAKKAAKPVKVDHRPMHKRKGKKSRNWKGAPPKGRRPS